MIICKNCGAEYDDEQDRCPYCGGDNFGKSVQVHEDMMNELKREKRQWEKMPEKVAGKGISWTAKLGIAAVIMVAVICIIVFIVSSISHKVSDLYYRNSVHRLYLCRTLSHPQISHSVPSYNHNNILCNMPQHPLPHTCNMRPLPPDIHLIY
jgi:hypothetical protein